MLNVLVTGAHGQFGQALQQQHRDWNIIPLSRADISVGNIKSLRQMIKDSQAEILIHAAANTQLEQAESDPDNCFRDNVVLTQILVDAVRTLPIKSIYLSSTGVYGNYQTTAYTEFDETKPTTIHHRSKLLAEQVFRQHCPNHLICRTGWLFGSAANNPRNFVANRLREAKNNTHLQCNNRQHGNPTYLPDLIDMLTQLIEKDLTGCFNIVNEETISRAGFVRAILESVNSACQVIPVDHFERISPVSDNESARNYKLKLMGLSMNSWRDGLAEYLTGVEEH